MISSFWILAFKNLKRNLKRNIATGSAIALGFTGILFLGGYANRLDNYLRVYTVYTLHTGHIAIFKKEGLEKYDLKPKKFSLTIDQQNSIDSQLKNIPEIEFYEKQLSGMGLIGNGCFSFPFVAHGFEPLIDEKIKNHAEIKKWTPDLHFFLKGRGLWNYDTKLNPIGLSSGLARSLNKVNIYDEIGSQNNFFLNCKNPQLKKELSKDANVQLMAGKWTGSVGVIDGEIVNQYTTGFEEGDNSAIQLSLTQLQNLFDTDSIQQYAIWLKNINDLPKVKERLTQVFSPLDVEIIEWDNEKLSPYYHGTTQFLNYLVSFIGIVLLIVILFSVLNSVTMTVLERSQEIGMYRSIGFRKSHVSKLFLIESFWLALISLLFGGLLTFVLITIVHALKIIYFPPGLIGGIPIIITLDPFFVLISAALILVLNLIVTSISVRYRLQIKIANLVGGLFR